MDGDVFHSALEKFFHANKITETAGALWVPVPTDLVTFVTQLRSMR